MPRHHPIKTHSTNYYNTFIEIAEDCPAEAGETPPQKWNKKKCRIFNSKCVIMILINIPLTKYYSLYMQFEKQSLMKLGIKQNNPIFLKDSPASADHPCPKNMAGEYIVINTEKLPCMDVKQENTRCSWRMLRLKRSRLCVPNDDNNTFQVSSEPFLSNTA